MKFNRRLVLVLMMVFACSAVVFAGCNGGRAKGKVYGEGTGNGPDMDFLGIDSNYTKPVFSVYGGVYRDYMKLTLSLPSIYSGTDYVIKYTLDSSEPSQHSIDYDGEVIELPHKNHTATAFEDEDMNVKVTVIRAACFNKYGVMMGQIETQTYIQVESKDPRFDLPVISLVTDLENLVDPHIGILSDRNYMYKGSEWERPVHVEFFETDGSMVLSQDGGIRLFGGSSRGLPQRSFRISARKSSYFETDVYDGAGKFKHELFPGRLKANGEVLDEYDSFILRNGGNDSIFTGADTDRATFIRDGLAALIATKAAPEVDNMAYRPVVVFLNGEYYGLMNMRERQDDNYIRNVYGIEDKENITIISSELDTSLGNRYDGTWFYYVLDEGAESELDEWKNLAAGIVNGEFTFEYVETVIDVDNFMKYCALNLFLCNTDWPHNNLKLWRYTGTDPVEGAYLPVCDGKWRFMIKDTDLGMGRYICAKDPSFPIELYTKADSQNLRFLLCNYFTFTDMSGYPSVEKNVYPDTLYIQGIFAFCLKNETFRNDFRNYCIKLASEIWPVNELKNLIYQCQETISHEMPNYFEKEFGRWQWKATTFESMWEKAVTGYDSLITWAERRTGATGDFIEMIDKFYSDEGFI